MRADTGRREPAAASSCSASEIASPLRFTQDEVDGKGGWMAVDNVGYRPRPQALIDSIMAMKD